MSIKRIWATRPEQQNKLWAQRIREGGYGLVDFPLLNIVPVDESSQQQRVKDAILDLDACYCVLFVSQNAVEYGFDWIEQYWPQFPDSVACLAVGAKTQAFLRQKMAEYYPSTSLAMAEPSDLSGMAMTSEALLAHSMLQSVDGKKIYIFRGLGGRTKLQEALTERGAQVQHVELYRRELPGDTAEVIAHHKPDVEYDILTFFSGETFFNFHQSLAAADSVSWQRVPLLVPSLRVAEQARQYAYKNIITADNASEDAMWSALQHYLANE